MTTNNPTETNRTVDLTRFKDSFGLIVSFTCEFGLSRKGDKSKVKFSEDADQDAAAKRRATVGKKLIESPEYDAIKSYMNDLRNNFIYVKTVPAFFVRNLQLCDKESISVIEERLKRAIGLKPQITDDKGNLVPELPQLVEAFLAKYPEQVEAARRDLEPAGQFRLSDYPSVEVLRDAFSISWNWLSFSAFTDVNALPEAIRQSETDKLSRQLLDAGEQITQALRGAFQKLIEHAKERLAPDDDGKRKKFNDSLIGNISEFLETFNSRNLMNDVDLARLVGQAKSLIASENLTPQKLRDSSADRESTVKAFEAISTELDKIIVKEPSRKITLADEDEPAKPEPATTATETTPAPEPVRELAPALFED
jgi:hypothetical protein